jgi:folate-dependent phosphoribosylglycinamide formyltransferase PurN
MKVHREDIRWVALYSGTGTEIRNLCAQLKVYPDVIITNTHNNINIEMYKLIVANNIKLIAASPQFSVTEEQYIRWFKPDPHDTDKKLFVTLHGWMKIVPPPICNQYEIYNLHPGDIENFPELKGKDPQFKAFKLKHSHCGCVIHKVTKELDSGEIVCSRRNFEFSKCKTYADALQCLHTLAFETWLTFFSEIEFTPSSQELTWFDKLNLKFFKLFR